MLKCLLPILLVVGCATVENSKIATIKGADDVAAVEKAKTDPRMRIGETGKSRSSKGLEISYEVNHQLSDQHYKLIHLTFENNTAEWIRLKNPAFDFGSPRLNQKVQIL